MSDTFKELEDAEEVIKLIREILDQKHFKGQPIKNLNRKRLLKVLAITVQYTKFAEERVHQLYAVINKLNKEKEDEQASETKIIA